MIQLSMVSVIKIKPIRYPNKEIGIHEDTVKEISNTFKKLRIDKDEVYSLPIEFYFESNDDLILLAMVNQLIKSMEQAYNVEVLACLIMTYVPYGRMDRIATYTDDSGAQIPYNVLSIKIIADFINSMNFYKVIIYDIHSEVTTALFNNCVIAHDLISVVEAYVRFSILTTSNTNYFLALPDFGAYKRYNDSKEDWLEVIDTEPFVLHKHRNFHTGKLQSEKVIEGPKYIPKGSTIIIVDDICSKGGTFLLTANALMEYIKTDFSDYKIVLAVSYVERSIMEGDLLRKVQGKNATFPVQEIITRGNPLMKQLNLEIANDSRLCDNGLKLI